VNSNSTTSGFCPGPTVAKVGEIVLLGIRLGRVESKRPSLQDLQ
jgi:hypothetical protein